MTARILVPIVLLLCAPIPGTCLAAGHTHLGGISEEERNRSKPNLPREHDRGFFLRLTTGVGNLHYKYSYRPITYQTDSTYTYGDVRSGRVSETASSSELAIGGLVHRNWAVHATIAGWSTNNHDDGMLGIGVTTFQNWGLVFSGSIGIGSYVDHGGVAEILAGKEWWIGGRWTLGAIGVIDGIPLGYDRSQCESLCFVATYN